MIKIVHHKAKLATKLTVSYTVDFSEKDKLSSILWCFELCLENPLSLGTQPIKSLKFCCDTSINVMQLVQLTFGYV